MDTLTLPSHEVAASMPDDLVLVELTSITRIRLADLDALVAVAVHTGWDSRALHTRGRLDLAGRSVPFYQSTARAALEHLVSLPDVTLPADVTRYAVRDVAG